MLKESDSFYWEELPNGKIRFIRGYYDPNTNEFKRTSLVYNKYSKKNERTALLALEDKVNEIIAPTITTMTFGELIEAWYLLKKQQVKPSTAVNISARNNVIKQELGSYIANNITDQQFNRFLLYLQTTREVAYSTAMQYKVHLEQIIEYGQLYEGLTIEPNLIVQKINVSKRDDFKYLEKYELQSVVDQLREQGDYETARYCLIQSMTGMRSGELSAINYITDIDWEEKTININKTYFARGKTFQTPKTGDSRTIHISDDLVALLKEQITATQRKILQANLPRDLTYLFLTREGNLCGIEVWSRRLSKVEIEGKKITTHIFRHTFITRMVENGVDMKLIAEHVGHSSTNMIEQVYSHFTELMNERLSEAVNALEVI